MKNTSAADLASPPRPDRPAPVSPGTPPRCPVFHRTDGCRTSSSAGQHVDQVSSNISGFRRQPFGRHRCRRSSTGRATVSLPIRARAARLAGQPGPRRPAGRRARTGASSGSAPMWCSSEGRCRRPGVGLFRHTVAPGKAADFVAVQARLVELSSAFPGFEGGTLLAPRGRHATATPAGPAHGAAGRPQRADADHDGRSGCPFCGSAPTISCRPG